MSIIRCRRQNANPEATSTLKDGRARVCSIFVPTLCIHSSCFPSTQTFPTAKGFCCGVPQPEWRSTSSSLPGFQTKIGDTHRASRKPAMYEHKCQFYWSASRLRDCFYIGHSPNVQSPQAKSKHTDESGRSWGETTAVSTANWAPPQNAKPFTMTSMRRSSMCWTC